MDFEVFDRTELEDIAEVLRDYGIEFKGGSYMIVEGHKVLYINTDIEATDVSCKHEIGERLKVALKAEKIIFGG